MTTHDPRREVEKFRELLASHDKPIALLIGAGASCAVNGPDGNPLIPAIARLGELCEEGVRALGDKLGAAWDHIVKELTAARSECNIEEILSHVRRKITAIGPRDTLAGLDAAGLAKLESSIQQTIAKAASPENSTIPPVLPHHRLARWIKRTDRAAAVEIFTTNYDTLLERGLEGERVATFDGFVGSRCPFFQSQSLVHEALAPGKNWVRLWKVHGSINWSWVTTADGSRRIVRGAENETGELIFPSFHKYDESRKQPYAAMLERLHRVLVEREDSILVTLGYSFGDEHINSVIFDALEVRDRLHVFSLQYEDPADAHELVTRAKSLKNLVVYGRRRAIVGGVVGAWKLHEPVDARLAPMMNIPFKRDPPPTGSTAAPLTGSFRLGDFQRFTHFLETISGSDD